MFLLPLLALIAPFILWPIEIIFPYPYIVEELAKAFLILLLRTDTFQVYYADTFRPKLKLVALAGILFALSESVLYLFNIYFVGNLELLLIRLIATSTLHVSTFLIIYIASLKSMKLLPLGIVLAVLVHYLFNLMVSQL